MTAIEWTDATWNPITGCTKVSPGCAYCYAERVDHRYDHDKVGKLSWALSAAQGGRGVTLHPNRLEMPLHWKKPRMVFVNSMSDLFHEDIPDDFIAQVFAVMSDAKQHTFQVLTKRPERARQFLARRENFADPHRPFWPIWEASHGVLNAMNLPLPNVWLGVSVENQRWASRLDVLAQIPAVMRFVSVEPLLGPVDLRPWLSPVPDAVMVSGHVDSPETARAISNLATAVAKQQWGLDWVIVGGESGGPQRRQLRPTDVRAAKLVSSRDRDHWVRTLHDQCVTAGVPFFFKQWGGPTPKSGGRLLDGREWNEMPI